MGAVADLESKNTTRRRGSTTRQFRFSFFLVPSFRSKTSLTVLHLEHFFNFLPSIVPGLPQASHKLSQLSSAVPFPRIVSTNLAVDPGTLVPSTTLKFPPPTFWLPGVSGSANKYPPIDVWRKRSAPKGREALEEMASESRWRALGREKRLGSNLQWIPSHLRERAEL